MLVSVTIVIDASSACHCNNMTQSVAYYCSFTQMNSMKCNTFCYQMECSTIRGTKSSMTWSMGALSNHEDIAMLCSHA